MKKLLNILFATLILIGCKNEGEKSEIQTDTVIERKTPAPYQVTAQPAPMQRFAALAALPDSTRILPSGDTLIFYSELKTGTVQFQYKVPTYTVKAKTTTTTPPVTPPPTTSKGYLSLPSTGAMDLSGKSNQVVENKRFTGISGVALKLYSGANNITIRNCYFDGNSSTGELVELENASNITIENCLFEGGYAGVYAVGSKNVKVLNCQFVNMRIRWNGSTFAGRGVFVQFNGCNSVEVSGCKGENFPEADPEDMISMYKTSNAVIKNNIFRGNPQSNWSASGGGIIGGDNGGDNILIEGNTLMTPGNYGVALAGGSNSKILNNKIYSERNAVSNNPLYTWGQGVPLSNITVSGNKVYWIDKNGAVNRGWNAGGTNVNYNPAENGTITKAEMNVPDHLIDFVTPAELLKIRGK